MTCLRYVYIIQENHIVSKLVPEKKNLKRFYYSRFLMARTALEPLQYVRDRGSSS